MILRGTLQGTNWVWEQRPVNTQSSVASITIDPDSNLWVVGSNGTILKSADNGESWVEYPRFDQAGARVRTHLVRIRFFERQGWIVGDNILLKCDLP